MAYSHKTAVVGAPVVPARPDCYQAHASEVSAHPKAGQAKRVQNVHTRIHTYRSKDCAHGGQSQQNNKWFLQHARRMAALLLLVQVVQDGDGTFLSVAGFLGCWRLNGCEAYKRTFVNTTYASQSGRSTASLSNSGGFTPSSWTMPSPYSKSMPNSATTRNGALETTS